MPVTDWVGCSQHRVLICRHASFSVLRVGQPRLAVFILPCAKWSAVEQLAKVLHTTKRWRQSLTKWTATAPTKYRARWSKPVVEQHSGTETAFVALTVWTEFVSQLFPRRQCKKNKTKQKHGEPQRYGLELGISIPVVTELPDTCCFLPCWQYSVVWLLPKLWSC